MASHSSQLPDAIERQDATPMVVAAPNGSRRAAARAASFRASAESSASRVLWEGDAPGEPREPKCARPIAAPPRSFRRAAGENFPARWPSRAVDAVLTTALEGHRTGHTAGKNSPASRLMTRLTKYPRLARNEIAECTRAAGCGPSGFPGTGRRAPFHQDVSLRPRMAS